MQLDANSRSRTGFWLFSGFITRTEGYLVSSAGLLGVEGEGDLGISKDIGLLRLLASCRIQESVRPLSSMIEIDCIARSALQEIMKSGFMYRALGDHEHVSIADIFSSAAVKVLSSRSLSVCHELTTRSGSPFIGRLPSDCRNPHFLAAPLWLASCFNRALPEELDVSFSLRLSCRETSS